MPVWEPLVCGCRSNTVHKIHNFLTISEKKSQYVFEATNTTLIQAMYNCTPLTEWQQFSVPSTSPVVLCQHGSLSLDLYRRLTDRPTQSHDDKCPTLVLRPQTVLLPTCKPFSRLHHIYGVQKRWISSVSAFWPNLVKFLIPFRWFSEAFQAYWSPKSKHK